MKHLLYLLLLVLIVPVTASAQSGWRAPERIEAPTKSNWFPSITVDPWGTAHVFWSSGTGMGEQAKDMLMYSSLKGATWSTPNDIVATGTGGWAARNSVAVDRSGRLHLLVRNRDHVYYISAAATDAWNARGWSTPRTLNGLGQPYYASIVVGPTGILHAIWEELSPRLSDNTCEGCSDVWYRRSLDNGVTWSEPINISRGEHGSIKLQLTQDANNMLYATWDEGKDPNASIGEPYGVAYAVSRDQGATWEPARRFSLLGEAAEQIALATDGVGNMIMVLRGNQSNVIRYLRSSDQGASWTEPAVLEGLVARDRNDTPWDRYAIATDSAGNIHLLAVGRRKTDRSPELFHVLWNAQSQGWQPPEVVAASTDYPEWPQFVIANGNQLHATWFTRSAAELHDSDAGAYQVWYSTRTVDAPEVAQPIVATPTPQPTATLEPTPTRGRGGQYLALQAINAPPPVTVRSETPLLRYLGLALVPVLVLLGCALIIVWRRRQQ